MGKPVDFIIVSDGIQLPAPLNNLFGGPLTIVVAGAVSTLQQAIAQLVEIPTDGSPSGIKFPAAPNEGDAVWVKTTGATVAAGSQASLDPFGNNVEPPLVPGTSSSVAVLMGPNPGVTALFRFQVAGAIWRQWM